MTLYQDQVECISAIAWFNSEEAMNVIHYINRMTNYIISFFIEKYLTKLNIQS